MKINIKMKCKTKEGVCSDTHSGVRNNLECGILENTNLEIKHEFKSLVCHFLAECTLP